MPPGIPTQEHEHLVAAYGASQHRAITLTEQQAALWWAHLDSSDLTASWIRTVGPALTRLLAAGQLLAATPAQQYVEAMLDADGLASQYEAGATKVRPVSFSGAAADGRTLDSLLYLPVIRTKTLLAGGMTLPEAMMAGRAQLLRMVASEVAAAGGGALGVATAANRTVTGYVRKVNVGACARCAILAGRWYRWNADFNRHKRCRCYGVPSSKARPGRLTDPMGFFHGLSRAEQDRRFGLGGAAAIRDGADIYSVVNAARSTVRLDAYGHKVVATLEGTTRRGSFYRSMRREAEQRTGQRFARSRAEGRQGLPRFQLRTPRLTPSEIYRLANGNRDEAIRMLRRFDYLY
ncbi:hypothetical protein OG530_19260 [Streptomyces decoyicus]|uniref:hypothetical protein n=1 Tax=Streptomyces decoyicus TaxID=249567 RepID=UPI002E18A635